MLHKWMNLILRGLFLFFLELSFYWDWFSSLTISSFVLGGLGRAECCEDRSSNAWGDQPCRFQAWDHPRGLLHPSRQVGVGAFYPLLNKFQVRCHKNLFLKLGIDMIPYTDQFGIRFFSILNWCLAWQALCSVISITGCPSAVRAEPGAVDFAGQSPSWRLPLLASVLLEGMEVGRAFPNSLVVMGFLLLTWNNVHGALFFSYSSDCWLSSSGNEGSFWAV